MNQKEAEKTERKLRPLYDAVDNGQNKKALQLADKILKKQDDLQCARALKAIAMLRMGRQEEAISTMKLVLSSHPGDQATLQACTMYFKETADFLKIAQMYADAAEHYPNNQEILTHLFMAYVRVGDYQKQQHTAIQLHKAFPDSGPYYCWRVMSILMQASDSKSNGKAKQLFLPLAEKLIDKYFAENDIDSEAEVRLYLMVLDKLDKTEKKLRMLDGPPGNKFKNRDERCELQMECLLRLEQWDRASVMLAEMVRGTPDQWSYIRQYISCQIKRCLAKKAAYVVAQEEVGDGEEVKKGEGCGELPVSGEADHPQDACQQAGEHEWSEEVGSWNNLSGSEQYLQPLLDVSNILESLAAHEMELFQSQKRTRYMVRGPLLARMEFVRQLYLDGMHTIPLGLAGIEQMLVDYFKLFGTKSCVFDDLCLFLDVFKKIDEESVLRFLQWVQQLVNSEPVQFDCADEDLKTNIARLTRHTNFLQLQIFMNCLSLDVQQLLDLCHHYHQEGAKLGRHLDSTVNHPSDFYAILAGHVLLDQYRITSDIRILWEAVFLLERAKNSNPQISLLLMKLYGILGANESITELFKELAIKHLQMETIGYITMRYIQSMGTFGFANQLYKSTLCFYYSASKEFSEYIIQSYKNGTFTKIEEFVNCRDRLTHSFNFVNTLTQMNTLEMLISINSIAQARDFFSKDWIPRLPCSLKDYVSSLMDNRDFTIYEDWSPSSAKLTDIQVKASFELECLWLRIRLSLVKCVGEAVAITGGLTPNNTTKDLATPQGKNCDLTGNRKNCERRPMEWPGTSRSVDGGGCEDYLFLGEVPALVEKVEEYEDTVRLMEEHMGVLFLRETLKQGSETRLPIQHPPPCLGYFFLQHGHGKMILNMLQVTVIVAKGSSDPVENLLKDILSTVETIKCQIRGVPDEFRQSLSKSLGSTSADNSGGWSSLGAGSSSETGEEKEAEPHLDHPYDVLTRVCIDLEPYVLLVQSLTYMLFLCIVCTELLVPSPKKESKKKKKKKAPPPVKEPSEAQIQLCNFLAELRRMISSLCRFFQPLPLPEDEDELTLKLRNLYLGKEGTEKWEETSTSSTEGAEKGEEMATPTEGAEKGEETSTPTEREEKGEETATPTEGVEKGEETATPTEGAEKGEETSTPTEGEENEEKLSTPSTEGVEKGEETSPPSTVLLKEKELKARVCKTVLSSYDMSLRDVMQLVSSKLDLASALIQQLGGEGAVQTAAVSGVE